jgi:ribosomal protein S25
MTTDSALSPHWLDNVRDLAQQHTRISAFMIHRRFRIPRPGGERLLRQLEREGIVGKASPGGSREVLKQLSFDLGPNSRGPI